MAIDHETALRIGDRRSSMPVYRLTRGFIRQVMYRYFRVRVTGELPADGPLIVAPVHRSNLDSMLVAGATSRRLRALGKESLFRPPVLRWYVSALGAVPVDRGHADRAALDRARRILERGEALIVFPEGTRQEGSEVAEVFDGVAFLAARTGAAISPIGIAGSDEALGSGRFWPRRTPIRISIGPAIPPPEVEGRLTRTMRRELTATIRDTLQAEMDAAVAAR